MHDCTQRSAAGVGDASSSIARLGSGFARGSLLGAGIAARCRPEARDKLIVATYSTSPPLAYVDDNGKLVGFEIDMAREIAKDLLGDPEKVEFVVVQSDGRFPAALSGKIDFGLCSTTITPDRAVRIAFTRPYLDTGGSVIARKDAGIKTVKELNDPKFTYAILNVPPAIARANGLALARGAPHPHAALLYYDFMIGDAGQHILAERGFVPARRELQPSLGSAPLRIVDPALLLDQGEKWARLYESIFLSLSQRR